MQKIMFNDKYGLTTAVLQRRKPMTRRSCKDRATNELILAADVESYRYYPEENIVEFLMQDGSIKVSVPPYKIGEVVAVAQSYKDLDYGIYGFATNPSLSCGIRKDYAEKQKGWGNKMFVSSKFMPHQILFTDVKIERLQDISDEDCLKEGLIKRTDEFISENFYTYHGADVNYAYVKTAFADLIDKVSGKGTWESNPYVFAYEFELVK